MAKGIDEKIENIQTSWDGYTGARVEEFIKEEINRLNSNKMGYITEDNDKYLFYSSEKAFNNGESSLGTIEKSQRYTLDVKEDINNKNVFLSEDSNKTFIWYFKTLEVATDSVYAENVTVEYVIQNTTLSKKETITTIINCNPDKNNNNYTKVVMNLDDFLENGKSLIEINVKGLKTNLNRPHQAQFTIITLNMEDITDFSRPFSNEILVNTNINCTKFQEYFIEYRIDGGEFNIENFKFIGAGYTETKELRVGIEDLPEGKHVFEYRVSIKLTDIEPYYTNTQRIEFLKGNDNTKFNEPQILIFSTYYGDDDSIITAEDGNLIINGVTQYIPFSIKYAVYNTKGSTNLEFCEVVNGENTNIIKSTGSNGVISNYEIQSIESGIKQIKILTKEYENGDTESEGIITNGDGRIIYLNVYKSDLGISVFDSNLRIDFTSVGKNNSADKDKWESIVKRSTGGSFINKAYFNSDYDWSQGWTNNGLVVSEGCEVTFDYVPFPLQKEGAKPEEIREYVGREKGYTFEIEFMTQNVTDENAVVCDMTYNGCGLLITGSEIRFTTPNGNSVNQRFKAEDMNRAVIVIRPFLDSSQNFVKGLVELYINGVMSKITKYTEEEKFQVLGEDENGNKISKPLTFKGNKGSDIVIKYIRAYNGVMTSDNIVDNYIIYRTNSKEMINLYNKNNVMNSEGVITPETMAKIGNIPILIFIGRTNADELASGDGNEKDDEPYKPGTINANEENWYQTLEQTTNKKKNIDMDVIYYNPLDKKKNFKFVKAYITPQGTSSMYYPKKNYRIYTQKNKDTRCFFSKINEDTNELETALELEQMLKSNFGESEDDRVFEKWRGTKNYKKRVYSFKDNSLPVKCWCLKADFAETSSSHNTGIARLWGDTLKNSTISIGNDEISVFKTNAQYTTEVNYNNNINGDMPDIRTTIDGFPIVVFGAKSYGDEIKFLGKYNFNNDKSTESVFGFCDIDDEVILTDNGMDIDGNSSVVEHTLDDMLDKYMCCVETLDNGHALANFATMENWDNDWENAFEFRYMEIPEEPKKKDYQDDKGNWGGKEGDEEDYLKDKAEYDENIVKWNNTRLKPFKHFAQWIYDTRWCDVNGQKLPELTEEEANRRKNKFSTEKWDHLDVWKMAAYYIYAMRFGAVDQIVKNSMLTSEGPFARDIDGNKYGYWDTTPEESPEYGKFYKWYYINYDNDTIMGVKNDGSLVYGPEITRKSKEGFGSTASFVYAGSLSTLWNNFDADEEFQNIIRIADQGISKTMTYKKAIEMFDVEQVGKWCERIYNKDADYKYIGPYIADWKYEGDDENAENFTDKLFMLQGSRTAHRRWWLSKRFNLFDGKWNSGDFAKKYVEVKCDYGSIGDTFSAVAGANAYFGYQINNKTFGEGAKDGGTSYEYYSNDEINWKLYKNIQIGDPIAIFGSADMLELNLMGLSNNLSSVLFYFGDNTNKLERLKLSVPDELLFNESSYKIYSDDVVGTVNRKTAFEKLKLEYPEVTESDFEGENSKYPTSNNNFDASDENSPLFYRTTVEIDGEETYIYFAKVTGGIRNYSCKGVSFDSLDKLQELYMAGYMGINSLDLSKNKFINSIDVRYSNITNISLSEGSRIREYKASSTLKDLSFKRCNNMKLQNIFIDKETLMENKGKNLINISVVDSDGLNHDSNFKAFILNWIKEGNVAEKTLNLTGINWTKVTVNDIKGLLKFIKGNENGIHATSCTIKGNIEMSNENISRDSMAIIDEFRYNTHGVEVTIKIPTNILIDVKESCVAGEKVIVGCEIYPNKSVVADNNGIIEYAFVKEVRGDDDSYDNKFFDPNTGKYYVKINETEVRENIKLNTIVGEDLNTVLTTEEVIVHEDTDTLIAVILTMNGIDRFDVGKLKIKDPTYAVEGNINGTSLINELGHTYKYDLSLLADDGSEPIGTIDIKWSLEAIDGELGNGLDYIASSAISEDYKTLTLTTHDENSPERIAKFNIKTIIDNYNASGYKDIVINKQITILNKDIIMTNETNPIVMEVCHEAFNTESPEYMTKDEAASVTDSEFATVFNDIKGSFTFDEFVYFTNLTTLYDYAFANSEIVSLTLPVNIKNIGVGVFENCKNLKNINLSDIIYLPEKTFLNCESLENLILPDTIELIDKNAFGGAGFKKILFKGTKTNENKTIFISDTSNLRRIINDAFGGYTIKNGYNITPENNLNEVSIPNKLVIGDNYYNFLFSPELSVINIKEESESIRYENGLLYADSDKTTLVRAIPHRKDGVILDVLELNGIKRVYNYAFYKCSWIKKIILGSELEGYSLGEGAFHSAKLLEEIDLSETKLNKLYRNTFNELPNLTTVKLSETGMLTTFGYYLFVNCPKLININLPYSVTTIETILNGNNDCYMFLNCGFEELIFDDNFGKNLTVRNLIKDCKNIKKVKLPAYLNTSITSVIYGCGLLEEVILPVFSYTNEENKDILQNEKYNTGEYAFIKDCPNLKKLTINELDNKKYIIAHENGALYKISNLVYNNTKEITEITELDEITLISTPYNISDYNKYILSNVNKLNDGAFYFTKITELIIPNNVIEIGLGCFRECKELKKVIWGENVSVISNSIFQGCELLEEIIILNDIEKIEAFAFINCKSLSKIVNLSTIVPLIDATDLITYSYDNDDDNKTPNVTCYSYLYHPFGYREYNLVGTSSSKENIFYLPYDYKLGLMPQYDTKIYMVVIYNGPNYDVYEEETPNGEKIKFIYDNENDAIEKVNSLGGYPHDYIDVGGKWLVPLFDPNSCNFKKEILKLNDTTNSEYITLKVFKDGLELTNGPLYLKSHSDELKFKENNETFSTTYNNDGFKILVDNNMYHNEIIYAYSNKECTDKIGEFIVKYGINNYSIGEESVTFNLRRNNTNNNVNLDSSEPEMISVSKREYEVLLSRVNQMSELLTKMKNKI